MGIFNNKKNYFTLSFSDHRVRLALAGEKGRLSYYSEVKLEPGIIERGQIKEKERLRQAIGALLKAAKLKQKFVVVGLPEIRAFTRTFLLPSLPPEELNEAARWESEPLLPFPLEKTYLDWMILEKAPEFVRILVVALPQDLVEDYAELLENMKLQPIAFETTSLSLARLIRSSQTAALIMEVKEKEAVLVVVGPKGGIEVSSTVAFKDENEAAEEITSTVKNVLNFYRKKVGGEKNSYKIAKILFCGEKARLDLVKQIREATGIPSAPLSNQEKELGLLSLKSLAQKNVLSPSDEKTINLIPPRIQGIYDQTARVKTFSFWMKVGLLSLFLFFFSYSVAAARVYFQMKKLEGEIIELQAAMSLQTKTLEEKARFLNNKSGKIVRLAGKEEKIISLLSQIRQTIPESTKVTHASYKDDQGVLIINGFAPTREVLLFFREALEKTEEFSRAQIPLTNLEKEENINFTITLTPKDEI